MNRLNGGIVFNEKGFVVILGESDTTTSPSAFRGDFVGGNLNSKASLLVWLVRAEEVTCLLHFASHQPAWNRVQIHSDECLVIDCPQLPPPRPPQKNE